MMRPALLALLAFAFFAPANAAPETGKPAPDFRATDSNGDIVRLSDFRRKIVILEWSNPGCPFVQKHYSGSNMQQLQTLAKEKGAVWLTVNSSAHGLQGSMDAKQAVEWQKKSHWQGAHYLIDADGSIGRSYDAKSTPHMFVVDADGNLAYSGAIDDKPSADRKDIAGAKNYVQSALESLLAGKKPDPAQTQAYGCSVKYAE